MSVQGGYVGNGNFEEILVTTYTGKQNSIAKQSKESAFTNTDTSILQAGYSA